MQKFTFIPFNMYYNDGAYNDIRRATVINFGTDLMKIDIFNQLQEQVIIDLLQLLEKGCYKSAIHKAHEVGVRASWDVPEFLKIYGERAYNLIQNLKPDSTVGRIDLLQKIIKGDIDAVKFSYMAPSELCPDLYTEIKKIEDESTKVEIVLKSNDLYTCANCKVPGVKKENYYNRCFDESVTHRLSCINCGNIWNE